MPACTRPLMSGRTVVLLLASLQVADIRASFALLHVP